MSMSNSNDTGPVAQECTNHHPANSSGECSIGWCPYNRWPDSHPENS